MAVAITCRRRHPRRTLPQDGRHVIEFDWPNERGDACRMPLKDISPAGLSFVLEHELPGLEICSPINGVTARLGRHAIRCDLVVIHITSGHGRSTICGALVYPATDGDLRKLKRVVGEFAPHA